MLQRQLLSVNGAHIAYLLACPRTREAVLLDPTDAGRSRYQRLLADLGWRLKYVLETRPSHARGDTPTDPYRNLLQDLGLSGDMALSGPRATTWDGVARVGPLPRWAPDPGEDDPDSLQLIEVPGSMIEIPGATHRPPGSEAYTVGAEASGAPGVRLRFDKVTVRFGKEQIEGWAAGAAHTLVWVAADRVFPGAPLYAGAAPGEPAVEHLTETILGLPDDVLVFPGVVSGGLSVSTVGQERAWRARRADVTPAPRPKWSPVVHSGGKGRPSVDTEAIDELGRPDPGGWRDVGPEDVARMLPYFRLVDLLEEDEHPDPAGRRMSLRELGRQAKTWNRGERILLMSANGTRCRMAATILARMGFTHLWRVEGGWSWWCDAGAPTAAGPPGGRAGG